MKGTLVVLAVTATGFAAGATYVHRQLSVERVRTQEEVASSNRLEQRVRPRLQDTQPKEFRSAEVASGPEPLQPLEPPRPQFPQEAVLTAVRTADSPNLEPRQPPSTRFREEQPDTARMSLRLIRERIQEREAR